MNEARAPRPILLALLAVVLLWAAYAPVIGAPFLWDDHHLIFESQFVKSGFKPSDYFDSAFFARQETEPDGRGYYRPLTVLSLALDYAVHATNASGFHLTNLLLHTANFVLFLGLLRRVGLSALAATVAATAWALAPRLTEAVAWISGRTDVLAGSFVLGALLLAERPGWWRRLGASTALLAGLLSKEVALAGVAAVAVLELSRPVPRRSRALALLPLAFALLIYAALRVHAIGGVPHGSGASWERRLGAAPEALGRYLVMLLDPWRPDIQIGHLFVPSRGYMALGVVVALALLVFGWRWRRSFEHPLERAGIVLAFAGFALVLHVLPLAVNVVTADRFLYVPLAGLILAGARPLTKLLARLALPIRAGVLAALLLSFGAVTWRQSSLWSDEIDFWSHAYVATKAGTGTATVELGNVYYRAGLHREAIAVFESNRDPTGGGMSRNNSATALQALGYYAEARMLLDELVRLFPRIPKYHLNLALAALSVGDFVQARRELEEALQRYPGYPMALHMLRQLPRLESSAGIPPGDGAAELYHKAQRTLERGRTLDAIRLLERAVRRGGLSRVQAEQAFLLANKLADPATERVIFQGYVAAHNGHPPAAAVEAHRQRREAGERLRALFPSLNLQRPAL